MAAPQDLSSLESDKRLYLYTSLTAGSSHIVTATSRLETILKANRIPFLAVDVATDEKCKKLWGRRAGKRRLPGLVKEGFVLGVCASFVFLFFGLTREWWWSGAGPEKRSTCSRRM